MGSKISIQYTDKNEEKNSKIEETKFICVVQFLTCLAKDQYHVGLH
jgi:hypothetical protein